MILPFPLGGEDIPASETPTDCWISRLTPATMPRTTLRYAVEHLDKAQRGHYMDLWPGLTSRRTHPGDGW